MLIAIASYADQEGRAFPSLARISERTGIDRRGLHREIGALVKAQLLRVEPRRDEAGDSTSNTYTIIYAIVLDRGVSLPETTPIAASDDTVSPQGTTPGVVSGDDLTDQDRTDQRTHTARRPAREPIVNSQGGASEFEVFWQAYPSRRPHANPRKPACDKFEAAVKRGIDPAAIIRGAENYRAAMERAGTDPRFVAQAMTWLNQERRNDHQQAPEPARLRAGMI